MRSTMPRLARGVKILAAVAGMASGVAAVKTWFRRDPDRTPPSDEGVLLAPADGRVSEVRPLPDGAGSLVVITLGLGDVHVQRAPVAGTVTESRAVAGPRWPVLLKQAAHNAGHRLTIDSGRGDVVVFRQAGFLARRVTCWVELGQTLRAGQQIGSIELGSRTEIELPPNALVVVAPGARTTAGETILARWSPATARSPAV